jgi:hypothetical protein
MNSEANALVTSLWTAILECATNKLASGNPQVMVEGQHTLDALKSRWNIAQWIYKNGQSKNAPITIDSLMYLLTTGNSGLKIVDLWLTNQIFTTSVRGSIPGSVYRDMDAVQSRSIAEWSASRNGRDNGPVYSIVISIPPTIWEYLRLFLYIYHTFNAVDVIPAMAVRNYGPTERPYILSKSSRIYREQAKRVLVLLATLNPTFWNILKMEYIRFVQNNGETLLSKLYTITDAKEVETGVKPGVVVLSLHLDNLPQEELRLEDIIQFKASLDGLIEAAKAILKATKMPLSTYINNLLKTPMEGDMFMHTTLELLENLLQKSVVVTEQGEILKVNLNDSTSDQPTVSVVDVSAPQRLALANPEITKLSIKTQTGEVKDVICLNDSDVVAITQSMSANDNALAEHIASRSQELIQSVTNGIHSPDDLIASNLVDLEAIQRAQNATTQNQANAVAAMTPEASTPSGTAEATNEQTNVRIDENGNRLVRRTRIIAGRTVTIWEQENGPTAPPTPPIEGVIHIARQPDDDWEDYDDDDDDDDIDDDIDNDADEPVTNVPQEIVGAEPLPVREEQVVMIRGHRVIMRPVTEE